MSFWFAPSFYLKEGRGSPILTRHKTGEGGGAQQSGVLQWLKRFFGWRWSGQTLQVRI